MKLLDQLDRLVRPIAIPNLTEILVAGQAATFLLGFFDPGLPSQLELVWSKVFQGEIWRVVTFLFYPPAWGLLVIFYFYIFMFMGRALEEFWGTVRYNTYFYLGAILTLLCGLLLPDMPFNGLFFEASLFLAFATLNPNYEFLIMLVIPVKLKWLAMFQGFMYLLVLTSGFTPQSMMVVASIGNYLFFFAADLVRSLVRVRTRAKWAANQMQDRRRDHVARHKCAVCGIDSKSHPYEDFRYCSKCGGEHAYCEIHLHEHEHREAR